MNLKLVTATTQEPLTRKEVKDWLRIDEFSVDEDPLIDNLMARARQAFEERTHRSVMNQVYDYYLDESEIPDTDCPIALPKAPLVSVTSIKGYSVTDADDLGGTAMSTSGIYTDTAQEFGRVMPVSGFVYPTATRDINALIIRFTAGYSSSPSGVPEAVKTELKTMIAALYEHRGDEPKMAQALEGFDGAEFALPTWG